MSTHSDCSRKISLCKRDRSLYTAATAGKECEMQRLISVILAQLLVITQCVQLGFAQATAKPSLRIVIVEGEGAINNVRQRVAREMIVQVNDENDRPIAGALVTFALPNSGAGGSFANGARLLNVVTDQAGRSVVQGFTPNNVVGTFQVNVTASYQGQTANAVISQTNASLASGASTAAGTAGATGGGGGISATMVGIIAAIAGGAAAAAVAIARGGKSKPAITIGTAGAPTVGAP